LAGAEINKTASRGIPLEKEGVFERPVADVGKFPE
jgi:hypothetical protein